jgi:hypothetical protein
VVGLQDRALQLVNTAVAWICLPALTHQCEGRSQLRGRKDLFTGSSTQQNRHTGHVTQGPQPCKTAPVSTPHRCRAVQDLCSAATACPCPPAHRSGGRRRQGLAPAAGNAIARVMKTIDHHQSPRRSSHLQKSQTASAGVELRGKGFRCAHCALRSCVALPRVTRTGWRAEPGRSQARSRQAFRVPEPHRLSHR